LTERTSQPAWPPRHGEEPRDDVRGYRLMGAGRPYELGDGRATIVDLTRVRDDAAKVRAFARKWGPLVAKWYPAAETYGDVLDEAFVLRQVLKWYADLQQLEGGHRAAALRDLRESRVSEWLDGRWAHEERKPATDDRELVERRRRWIADRIAERLTGVTVKPEPVPDAARPSAFERVPRAFPNLLSALYWHLQDWIESRQPVGICELCHEVFAREHGNQRFCTTKHSQQARDRKRYQRAQKSKTQRRSGA